MNGLELPADNVVSLLANEGRDYCLTHGLVMGSKDSFFGVEHAPFTLLPTAFLERLFTKAKDVQKDFNVLVHRVSQDHEFLKTALQSTIEVDSFTAKIFDIYETTRTEGLSQPISLGILRSDYMMDCSNPRTSDLLQDEISIKQVEINTIASSFGGLSPQLRKLHKFLTTLQTGYDPKTEEKLPKNSSCLGIATGLVDAWKYYGNENSVVLMVVQGEERNRYDQRWVQHLMAEVNPAVRMVRKSFKDINRTGQLQEDKTLIVDGQEIAVVYFREGYDPSSYTSENDWNARLMLERSRAIKCPSAALHLAGTKKVQQVLASPGVLERFISDKEVVNKIRSFFTGLYTLDEGLEGDKTMQLAIADPDRYVLKPQLEGGGNNIYGDDIVKTLADAKERSKYILMDKIQPPVARNFIVRSELPQPVLADVISEIGFYGILISQGDEILVNREVGHLMRTKSIDHQDGMECVQGGPTWTALTWCNFQVLLHRIRASFRET
ncbi:PREDICTED: glutathione synthetase-like isoform X2 [Acropora digitifera]|uniref:glutathione synthetase-like isoform X2 n=1 Tax=Acropora digitifera TaxID=70779 RepID=UPI00077AEA51|nr:PREDICTED: glutathione synthetase-like isoform X2 [Acropora digitifera]